jgi:hypothetical protein
MAINLSSPVTGSLQTDFTAATYTVVSDLAPDSNGKQYAVTALGGTQVGVSAHTVSKPFTFTAVRPKQFKNLGQPNPVTGVISNVPRNRWKFITRKGVSPESGQPNQIMLISTTVEVPAGSDLADPEDLRAALSLHFGALTQLSAEIGNSAVSGVF